ncbi:MAG: hypothetical protein HWE35_21240 [Rhodobacteraceae bacterium]|nr:hypothetical protein [Paracoccaceae bacterium]
MGSKGAVAVLGAAAVVGVYAAWRETQRKEAQQQAVIMPAGYVTGGAQQKLAALQQGGGQGGGGGGGLRSALVGWGVDTLFDAISRNGWLGGSKGKTDRPATSGGLGGLVRDTLPTGATNTNSAPTGGGIGNRLMRDLMRDFGFTRAQAAGVVGNLDHESDGFKGLQEYNPIVKGSRGGYGYAQWTGPRRRQFEAWAAQNGHSDLSTYEANYGFLKYEMSQTWEKRAVDRVKQTNSVEDATKVFQDTFLRPGIPHTSSRIQRAQGYV